LTGSRVSNNCWIVPRNAPACRRDVQPSDQKELQDGGYAKFRIAVDQDAECKEAAVYVQGWPREVDTSEWVKAAWGLFGAHTALQVFRPDGSTLDA
jgi:hypothetical protein